MSEPLHSAEKGVPLDERVRVLEEQVAALITALHLTTVAAKPASEWLDASLAKINPGPFDTAIPPCVLPPAGKGD